jgi:hypothetical protein
MATLVNRWPHFRFLPHSAFSLSCELEGVETMPETIITSKIDSTVCPGLPGRDYHSPEIYQLERERIFFRSWFCIGREGSFRTRVIF